MAYKYKADAKAWRTRNKAHVQAEKRKWYVAHREEVLARSTSPEGRIKNRKSQHRRVETGKKRWDHLWQNYGLTQDAFSQMLGEQMGYCKTCGCSLTMRRHQLDSCHVDHNHKTGKVRGLLCANCNLALGNAKDNPITLQRMIDYLKEHNNVI